LYFLRYEMKKYHLKVKIMITRCIILIALISLFYFSCDLITPEPGDVSFRISQHILPGYFVTAISFDSKGTAWIGTFKQGLIRYDGSPTIYDSNNSLFSASTVIFDIAVDRNDNIWIGTNEGLIKFDGKNFTVYNTSNSQLAEDAVWAIAVDRSNSIWLASCRFRRGGLMKFDGSVWKLFTPENSLLPDNSIADVTVDRNDNIWVSVNASLHNSRIVRINGDAWEVYGDTEIGFSPYYFMPGNLALDTYNNLYISIDYGLSSMWDPNRPGIVAYTNEKWRVIYPSNNEENIAGYVLKIGTDLSGNLWAGIRGDKGIFIAVYNGNKWKYHIPEPPIEGIYEIKADKSNTVWLGSADGIYLIQH
jgi:hypothetical protein